MAGSVTIQQLDPLGIAAQAVGDYTTRQRQNGLDDAAARRADAAEGRANTQLGLNQNADARAGKKLTDEEQQQIVDNANTDRAAVLAAKKEADEQLDKEAANALATLKEQNAKTKNDQEYAFKVKQLRQQLMVEKAKLTNAKDVATIHAQATTGAAAIRASAEVQAAGIHASVEERGQDLTHSDKVAERGVVKRGQDLTFQRTEHGQNLAHNDRVATRNYGMTKADQAIVATAIARLAKTKGAPPVPSDDPQFDGTMALFSKMKPEERDRFLSATKPDGTPAVPQSTHAYLQALTPVFSTLNH